MSNTIDLKGRRIALIGGAGFIGHNLALHLKQRGAEPHVVDGMQVNNLGSSTFDVEFMMLSISESEPRLGRLS
ncbi:hypothetical protein SAMN06295888_1664 [Desulfonatronum zhilinae]|nr:hypothetical protein SAMN06295888_1664 [Desulfonatronum zhilinae]